jgi:hypothetical protein
MDILTIALLLLPSVLGAEKLFSFDSDLSRSVPECKSPAFLNCKKVIEKELLPLFRKHL